jgi:signal recognition particle receptor subunit beta
MVVVSYSGKEINAKIVYYGPGLGGKTTNLERIYDSVPSANKGKMISMKTKADRTLFFDFLPLELGEIGGYRTRFMLYTVPGQVYYNATRKLVLKGVDAVVFVADSERGKMRENQISVENLRENLESYGIDYGEIPIVFQYNKRDLADKYTREELDEALGRGNRPFVEAVAARGEGVFETLRVVSELLLERLKIRLGALQGGADPQAPRTELVPEPRQLRPGQAGPAPVATPAPAKGATPERPAARAPIPLTRRSAAPSEGKALEGEVGSPSMSPALRAQPPAPRTAVPLKAVDKSPAPAEAPAEIAKAQPVAPARTRTPEPEPTRAARAPEPTESMPAMEPLSSPSGIERNPFEILRPRGVEVELEAPSAPVAAAVPRAAAPMRIVVPVEIDLDDLRDGEPIEIVLKLSAVREPLRRVSG